MHFRVLGKNKIQCFLINPGKKRDFRDYSKLGFQTYYAKHKTQIYWDHYRETHFPTKKIIEIGSQIWRNRVT